MKDMDGFQNALIDITYDWLGVFFVMASFFVMCKVLMP